jgi:hypothetical protein
MEEGNEEGLCFLAHTSIKIKRARPMDELPQPRPINQAVAMETAVTVHPHLLDSSVHVI